MTASMYYQVNIDRKTRSGGRLGNQRWADFVEAVKAVLAGATAGIPQVVGNRDETSSTFVAVWDVEPINTTGLAVTLKHIADTYEQETIALVVGTSTLCYAESGGWQEEVVPPTGVNDAVEG